MINTITYYYKKIKFWITASNAKGHGTHSPFVYHFIENVLNDNRHFYDFDNLKKYKTKTDKLIFRIIVNYQFKNVCYLDKNKNLGAKILLSQHDAIVIDDIKSVDTIELDDNETHQLQMILIKNIDKNKWLNNYFISLQQNKNFNLSINLFSLGIVVFNKNILQPQHFNIKFSS